jgi:hypothetical protein
MRNKIVFNSAMLMLLSSCAVTTAKLESKANPSNRAIEKKIFVAVGSHEKTAKLTDQISLKLDSVLTANKFKSYVYKYESNILSEDEVRAKIKEFGAPLLLNISFAEGQSVNGALSKATFSNTLSDVNEKAVLWKAKIDLDIGNGLPHTWEEDGVIFSRILYNDLVEKKVITGL